MKSRIIDDFSEVDNWQAIASGQAALKLSSEPGNDGAALQLDFDFKEGGGFVVARKEFGFRLPEAFSFSFRIRGEAPRNNLEFKLTDPGGRNVWRWQEDAFDFQPGGRRLLLKSSDIRFAWGPAGGGTLRKLGAIEFAIRAGPGGKGTVWIEDFKFDDCTCRKAPAVTASSSADGCRPELVLNRNAAKGWRSSSRDSKPWLQMDFHQTREYGGLVIEWEKTSRRRSFVVRASVDGRRWRPVHRARRAHGERSFVRLPNGESRFLRLAFSGHAGIRRIEIQPVDFSRSLTDFVRSVAGRSLRGRFPRYFYREQSYWTCAGSPGGSRCALLNEEGLVEPGFGTFTLEPFIHLGGKLITWADAKRSVRLEKGGIPIPSVRWTLPTLRLETTLFGVGHGSRGEIFVRYRLRNASRRVLQGRLFVAIRPFQVTPPWQSWHGLGGVSETRDIIWKHGAMRVNGARWIVPLSKPISFGAAAFEEGEISEHLSQGWLPPRTHVRDDSGLASAAMCFDLKIAVGGSQELYVAVPCGLRRKMDAKTVRRIAGANGPEKFEEALHEMGRRVGAVSFHMPPGLATAAAATFFTAAGQILLNRDGPALQPGPRRYSRSWIRDGAIMGAALLRTGDRRAFPEFIRWYATHQRKDGFVPCSVDRTGPDWLVEHDSHGQFIFAVMESFRFTKDRTFLKALWPHIRKAARCIESLRRQRMTEEYRTPGRQARYGLLPESVSHEGYLSQPVHAYWDDFWALRGLMDAAAAALELGRERDAEGLMELAGAFRETLGASVRRVISENGLSYVPGSVEWADFDPTATANAITLLNGTDDLPARQLDAMFETYMRDFRLKRDGKMPWNNYSAYEVRIVGALVRLGKRAEALELLDFFLSDRRPRNWNQWPEISWKNPRSPGHIGDMPHSWIAAEYMLAFASLFAYEREADSSLIIAAGVDDKWLSARGGIGIQGLPTRYGLLDLAMQRTHDGTVQVELGGELRMPPGGFVVRPPGNHAIRSLAVNGTPVATFKDHEAIVQTLPAHVMIGFEVPGSPRPYSQPYGG
jgi:hypothetical protein